MNITLRQNVTNRALSQYSNFFFDRGIVRIGPRVLALNCQNLCELGGGKDNLADIQTRIQTGLKAFTSGRKKVRSFHVRGQFNSSLAMVLNYTMDSSQPNLVSEKAITGTIGSDGGNIKFHGRRDVLGEYLCVELRNVSGQHFLIDDLTAITIPGRRL